MAVTRPTVTGGCRSEQSLRAARPAVAFRPVAAPSFDVVGIGNALVDVIAHAGDAFLDEHALVKGSMELIDTDRAVHLYRALGSAVEMSGGSAANTMCGVASFGGRGRVHRQGVATTSSAPCSATTSTPSASPSGPGAPHAETPTGRCIIVVTPDAQRTMNTYLGVSSLLSADDLDEAAIADGAVLYMEGYLFDRDDAKKAFRRAAGIAHANGRKVSLTLSDSFCVDRHRDDFAALVRDEVDILFGNEDELCSLYQLASLDDAIAAVRAECELAAITAGKDGSYVVTPDDVVQVPADEVARVLDTTGAGDLYAAGFLYGYTAVAAAGRVRPARVDRRRRGDQPRRPPAARGAAYIVAVTAAEARSVAERWLAAEPDHDIQAELQELLDGPDDVLARAVRRAR